MSRIVVIGSINIDLVVTADHFAAIGETMFGTGFETFCGGKGANQAVCAANLGAVVHMVGCVGDDANGRLALGNLRNHRVNTDYIEKVEDATGVALITVAEGNNQIIVVKGANQMVDKAVIDKALPVIEQADLVMMQLEIPLETVNYVLDLCQARQIDVILNPAPYHELDASVIDKVTYLTPNEVEIDQMFGVGYAEVLAKHPNKIIMTAGKNGVYYHDGQTLRHCLACKVEVMDTTGAGDTFNGALAVALTRKWPLSQCIVYAQKAAGIAIGKMGAQTAMPTEAEMMAVE